MTNYNERLDEVLSRLSGKGFDTAFNNPDDYMVVLLKSQAKAKQALTSLIKELVEEAYAKGFKKASEGAFKSQQDAKREARLNEVQNAYEDWINAEAGFHADYLRGRISELTKPTTYTELKAEKTEALRPIAKEIVDGLTKGEQE